MNGWRKSKRPAASRQPNLPGLFAPLSKSRRLATPQEQALEVAKSRLLTASLVFVIAYFVIAGRLAYLTLLNDAPGMPSANEEVGNSAASRADITDRNGVVLATSLPTNSLCADDPDILNPDQAEKQLLTVLPGLDPQKLHDQLRGTRRCVMIMRHLTPKQYYEVNKLGIAGLEFRPDERRIYPAGGAAAHVTGYTDVDDNGIGGMEKEFDTRLEEDPDPLVTSVDLRVQSIMRHELNAAMTTFHAVGGAGLVMDIKTGELLAMVSLPDFNPEHPGDASPAARFNRDTLGVYEMGSTFKIFNTALAFDTGAVRVADTFDTTHPVSVGSRTIKDFEKEHRWLNVAEIFTHSSNIGSARMVQRIGPTRQRAFLSQLGLTEKIKLEIPEVGAPLAPSVRDWGEPTMLTAAFGHGIAVNAVQLAGAVATIVNNGIPVHPTLLHRPEEEAVQATNESADRLISPHTSAMVRALMRLVVTRGTAKGTDVPGYMVGGKTGTADELGANHRYANNARLSSFIAVFPMNAPKYLVFAMLDDPKGDAKTHGFATGGWTAAPVVSHVISRIGPLLDVQPLTPDMEEAAERQLMKPLGNVFVDGLPVQEGSNYASVQTDSVQ